MSTRWQTRPSELLGVDDVLHAFWFDEAIYYFGTEFENDLEESTKSKGKKPDSPEMTAQKRQRRLDKWLEGSPGSAPRFRDPNQQIGQRKG